jgi:uncharacterized SAM-binding protein YcdF (DUF218 family)
VRRRTRWLLGIPAALAAAYGLGFAWFLRLTEDVPPLPAHADAIVVLTGGPERIETGLRLLTSGQGGMLLISGLGGGASLADLARRAGMDPAPLAGRVDLGRKATTTRTNATETAQWVRQHGFRTLILVTADYHMPRALLELHRAMPEIALHPAAVVPRTPSWRLWVEEYSKWLLAALRLSARHPAPA